jgi:alkanesulfonate monooxygenase SsuD/methylene tetrahydromethanopterin reductase-like flavin-dependent oxidoreductase (luciferase family)
MVERSGSRNRLALGMFGANCTGGLGASTAPEQWVASWDNNVALAKAIDAAGFEFNLPIARWRGFGGATNHNNEAFDTFTWAAGILAVTERLRVFSTVHVTLINPVVVAKQGATLDRIGNGRWGLNVVCGWYEKEFGMFGVNLGGRDRRYELGEEWLAVLERAWSSEAPFDHAGEFFTLTAVVSEPKPVQRPRPPIVNAGRSGAGRAFAVRNADVLLTPVVDADDIGAAARDIASLRREAGALRRRIQVYTPVYVICRKTRRDAEAFHHHYAVERADAAAVETMIRGRDLDRGLPEAKVRQLRMRFAGGQGSYPIVGDPDDVAAEMQRLSDAGFDGLAMGSENYLAAFPFFRAEVMPRLERLGLRSPA